MIQVELIGCTGAGKSTLLASILHACREQGLEVSTGDEYVLEKAHLNRIRSYLARTLFVDLFSLFACLRSWRKHSSFYTLVFRMLSGLKDVGLFERLNILRNTLKKVGIYEIVLRDSGQRIVLLDEGTLHTAHYLFIHLSAEFSDSDLLSFIESVPLPDTVIYLRQEQEVLVERTLARGHKRVHDGSRSMTERFIHRAVTMFDKLVQTPTVVSRLLVVDPDQTVQTSQPVDHSSGQARVLTLLRSALVLVNTGQPGLKMQTHLTS